MGQCLSLRDFRVRYSCMRGSWPKTRWRIHEITVRGSDRFRVTLNGSAAGLELGFIIQVWRVHGEKSASSMKSKRRWSNLNCFMSQGKKNDARTLLSLPFPFATSVVRRPSSLTLLFLTPFAESDDAVLTDAVNDSVFHLVFESVLEQLHGQVHLWSVGGKDESSRPNIRASSLNASLRIS